MSKRVYLSGPINSPVMGVTPEDCRAEFRRLEKWLTTSTDWTVVNPLNCEPVCLPSHEQDGPFDGHFYGCWLRGDLAQMLTCDAILMLSGWTQSRGAKLEFHVARDIGMELMFLHCYGSEVLS